MAKKRGIEWETTFPSFPKGRKEKQAISADTGEIHVLRRKRIDMSCISVFESSKDMFSKCLGMK